MEDPLPWLMLARAPGLHAGQLRGRVDPLALTRESPATLRALELGESAIAALQAPDRHALSRDERWLAGPQRRIVAWGRPGYPPQLANIEDAPLVLFVEGSVEALSVPQLAVVGSRHPTLLGRDTAEQFAQHLVRGGLAVTSGLALGIDAAGHRGALAAGGMTVAVLGCGLDVVYPRANRRLAEEIVVRGALVSDLPLGAPPLKQHFPRRNRIISGLSLGTLVVEAALQSGSLITAHRALGQGREVFAIPGSIHNPMARGCHRLLREGAKLVESVDDIFSELGPLLAGLHPAERAETPDAQAVSGHALDKDYEILLDALGFAPASIDALATRSGFAAGAVASMLLILELEGRVAQQHGGLYSRRLPGKT